jgi:hypothetical protein
MNRKNRHAAAAVLAFALSLLVAPAALAERLEGELLGTSTATVEPASGWEHNKSYIEYLDGQQPASQSSADDTIEAQMPKAQVEYLERLATVEPAPGWEHNKSYIEYLDGQQPASQSSTDGTIEAQMPKAQVEYLERLAAAASGEPAGEATDASGPSWLLGAGVVAAVAISSVVVAAIRSRRPETAGPVDREREKLTV